MVVLRSRWRTEERIIIVSRGGRLEWKLWLCDAHGANVMWSAVVSGTIQSPLFTFSLLCSSLVTLRSVGWGLVPASKLDIGNNMIIIITYMTAHSRKERKKTELELFYSSRNVRSLKAAVKSV